MSINYIPKCADSKRPACAWQEYQHKQYDGFVGKERGVICGAISGNLEVLDLDHDADRVFNMFVGSIPDSLYKKLYVESTPSGGRHVYYRRSDAVPGNRQLAMKLIDGKWQVLTETRGEGGFVVCAPSNGYVAIDGDLDALRPLDPDEVESLVYYASFCDERTEDMKTGKAKPKRSTTTTTFTGSKEWEEALRQTGEGKERVCRYLEEAGWEYAYSKDEDEYYLHPNASGEHDCSIVVHREGNVYCFGTSGKNYPFDYGEASTVEALQKLGGFPSMKELSREYYKVWHPEADGKDSSSSINPAFAIDFQAFAEKNKEKIVKTKRPVLNMEQLTPRLPKPLRCAIAIATQMQHCKQPESTMFAMLALSAHAIGRHVYTMKDQSVVDIPEEFREEPPAGREKKTAKDWTGQTNPNTNIFVLSLGESGSGKQMALDAVDYYKQSLYDNGNKVTDVPSSDVAMIESMWQNRKQFYTTDEAQDYLFGKSNGSGPVSGIKRWLKSLFTMSNVPLGFGIARSARQKDWKFYDDRDTIHAPHTCMYATGVLASVRNQISADDINNGLAGRLLYCYVDKDAPKEFDPCKKRSREHIQCDTFDRWLNHVSEINLREIEIEEGDSVRKMSIEHEDFSFAEGIKLEWSGEAREAITAIGEKWDKAGEVYMARVQQQVENLVYVLGALSIERNADDEWNDYHMITAEDVDIARTIVEYSSSLFQWLCEGKELSEHATETQKAAKEDRDKIVRYLRKALRKGDTTVAGLTWLHQTLNFRDAKRKQEGLEYMISSGLVTQVGTSAQYTINKEAVDNEAE